MTRAKLLFTISCVLLSFSSFGQIRIIEKGLEEFIDGQFVQTVPGGTEDLSGTTQLVSIAGDNSTNKFIIWVVNESTTETYDVVCRRLETSVIPGTLNNTCWSLCPFPDKPAGEAPDWIVAPNNDPTNYFVESIAPGDTITSFEQKYFAESIAGCSDFELRFENANNLGEIYASFNVSFGTPDCINSLEEIEAIETLKMYPNPSNDFVNLDLMFPFFKTIKSKDIQPCRLFTKAL